MLSRIRRNTIFVYHKSVNTSCGNVQRGTMEHVASLLSPSPHSHCPLPSPFHLLIFPAHHLPFILSPLPIHLDYPLPPIASAFPPPVLQRGSERGKGVDNHDDGDCRAKLETAKCGSCGQASRGGVHVPQFIQWLPLG